MFQPDLGDGSTGRERSFGCGIRFAKERCGLHAKRPLHRVRRKRFGNKSADHTRLKRTGHGIFRDGEASQGYAFGHGGLLSTALEAGTMPPQVGYKVLADSVLTLLFFLGNVCILENLESAPLEMLMREFDEAGKQSQ